MSKIIYTKKLISSQRAPCSQPYIKPIRLACCRYNIAIQRVLLMFLKNNCPQHIPPIFFIGRFVKHFTYIGSVMNYFYLRSERKQKSIPKLYLFSILKKTLILKGQCRYISEIVINSIHDSKCPGYYLNIEQVALAPQ